MNTRADGILGEQIAVEYLVKEGYSILARNYRQKVGEIDVIFVDKEYIVFCEVKKRSSSKYGFGIEAVTPSKISRIIKTAELYLLQNHKYGKDCRFDVIVVDDDSVKEHIKNAFTKQDAGRKKHW